MIYQMCVFRVEPYDPPRFWGALFLLVCLLFSLSQKQQSFLGNVFCLFLSCCFSETSSPKSAKNTENKFFISSVFGWFFLFVFKSSTIQKAKKQTKTKHNNTRKISKGLACRNPKALDCSPFSHG